MNNDYLIGILKCLSILDNHLQFEKNGHCLLINKSEALCEISKTSIEVLGQDFTSELLPHRSPIASSFANLNKISELFEVLIAKPNPINHMGISYSCSDSDAEILKLKRLVKDRPHLNLYEEVTGNNANRWLFISNSNLPEEPIFEIVLNKRDNPIVSSFVPHFQIDIDTGLSASEVRKILHNYFGNSIFKWELEVPGYGVPLIMIRLASIHGFKIYLGIGTSVRGSRSWHRQEHLTALEYTQI